MGRRRARWRRGEGWDVLRKGAKASTCDHAQGKPESPRLHQQRIRDARMKKKKIRTKTALLGRTVLPHRNMF